MADHDRPAGGRAALSRRGVLLATAAGAGAAGAGAVAGLSALSAATAAAEPLPAAMTTAQPAGGRLREYWVQADSWWHNPVPNGRDNMMGTTYTDCQTSYWA